MLSEKERDILLILFKDFTCWYNAHNLSKIVGMTPRGTLKALKNLERQHFVNSKQYGNAIGYKINFNPITKKTLELLLLEEADIKNARWSAEFKDFGEAKIIILFGSALKGKRP